MSLSCSCDYDGEADWYWWPPKDYSIYKKLRGQHCCCKGCTHMIGYGQTVGEVTRSRPPTHWEIEYIVGWGDEADPEFKYLASAFMCERCTDLFFSFQDLGFECVSPYESMVGLAKEYHDIYGRKDKDIDTSDIPELDKSFFDKAELTKPGDKLIKGGK